VREERVNDAAVNDVARLQKNSDNSYVAVSTEEARLHEGPRKSGKS